MAAAPGSGADGHTGLHNLRLKVIHVLSVGVAGDMVRGFCHDDGADSLGDSCNGGDVDHFKLISTAEHSTTHWWC